MNGRKLLANIFILILAPGGLLSAQNTLRLDDTRFDFRVEGTATMKKDWSMTLRQGNSEGSAVFERKGDEITGIAALDIRIRAEGLDGGVKGMNKDAWEALKTDRHPYVEFRMERPEKTENAGEAYLVTVSGGLTMAGVTRTVTLEAACRQEGDKSIRCDGACHLLLSDYGVAPPQAFLGMLKVDQAVKISYSAIFRQP